MFGISLVKHEVTAAFLQSTKSAAEILKNSPQLTSVSASPTEEASQPCPSEKCFLILDCSGVTFFDYSGVSMLVEVYMDCKSRSVDVSLAHCTASLMKAMKYCGNPDSEKPISFESVSAALSNIYSNKNLSKLSDHSEV